VGEVGLVSSQQPGEAVLDLATAPAHAGRVGQPAEQRELLVARSVLVVQHVHFD
jgi:hypothetical protein